MHRSLILFCFVLFLGFVGQAGAHPPSEIELTYDAQGEMLEVRMTHVVRNPRDHYIRKVELTKNSGEPRDFYFPAQVSPHEFKEKIPLKAEPGDEITIKAFCNKAGTAEAVLTIPYEKNLK